MLQRIQTLYLILIVIAGMLLAVLPIFTLIPNDIAIDLHQYTFSFLQVSSSTHSATSLFMRNWILLALDLFISGMALATIFGYKNRRKQRQWCTVISMVSLFLMALTLYTINTLRVAIGAAHTLHFSWTMILIIIEPIIALMAAKAIKKDDDLIRSADRLR